MELARRLPSLLYSLGTGILIGSAPLIVAILYDPRYATAALYFQILSISALFSLTSNAGNEALVATGRIGITFQANVAKFIWFVTAAPIGHALWGVTGLVLGGIMGVFLTIIVQTGSVPLIRDNMIAGAAMDEARDSVNQREPLLRDPAEDQPRR